MSSNQTKKIVLILVEGPSDEESLEHVLTKLINNYKTKFKICRGDITSDKLVNTSNVTNIIAQKVEDFLQNAKGLFTIDDICFIAHLIDTDACSIQNEKIIEQEKEEPYFDDQFLYVKNKNNIIKRNQKKLPIVKKLSKTRCISFDNFDGLSIPYCSYYMSCNLEHVLHNDKTFCSDNAKENYSILFSMKYFDKENEFVEFINSKEVGTTLNFENSWDNILKPQNALLRETNLNIFVNDFKN